MGQTLVKLISKFLDALYPENYVCLSCGKEIAENKISLCNKCMTSLPYLRNHLCAKCDAVVNEDTYICDLCKSTSNVFVKNYSAFDYSGAIRKLLLDLKYYGAKYNADTLSNLLYEKYLSVDKHFDVIIPVPLHKTRLEERHYNQSELLLTTFVENGLNVKTDVLIRVLDTPHQAGLNRMDRLSNLKDCFKVVDKSSVKGKDVLVVDDVFTTGATVNECAITLLNAKAKSVTVLTLCRNNYKE